MSTEGPERKDRDWEHGDGKPPRWVGLLGWLAAIVLAAIIVGPAVLELMGRD